MDIQVINVDATTRQVSFGIKPKKLTGISKLTQIVVLSLLNVPGRDVLDPSLGGGLPSLLDSNIDPNDSTQVFSEIARRLKKSESEIISAQIGVNDPPEEKLVELQLVSLGTEITPDSIQLTIRIINQAGQATDVLL